MRAQDDDSIPTFTILCARVAQQNEHVNFGACVGKVSFTDVIVEYRYIACPRKLGRSVLLQMDEVWSSVGTTDRTRNRLTQKEGGTGGRQIIKPTKLDWTAAGLLFVGCIQAGIWIAGGNKIKSRRRDN